MKQFKKCFLTALIISLIISAFVGIYIVLFGTFSETEAKILGTTLAIGGFSLTGLSCSALYEKKIYPHFAKLGILVSITAFILSALSIWEIVSWQNETFMKTMVSFFILAFSWAHASLIFMIKPKESLVRGIQWATIAFISIVAGMFIALIIFEQLEGELYARFIGAFAILDVLGTLVTPIMNKIYHHEHK